MISISIWKSRTFIYLIEEYMDKNIQFIHQDADQPPQQTLTSFRVLNHLLSTNQNFEHLKKKIKVKESMDHHNLNQIKNHSQLLMKLKNVRHRHDQFEKQKQIVKTQQFSCLKNLKVKNTTMKTQHSNKIQELRKEISESKENEYKMICQQRKSIQQNIQRFKENILMQKRKKRDKVVSREKSGKKVCNRYFNDKCEEVYQNNIEDIARMTMRIQERERQRQKLQKIEIDRAAKQSKSQAQFKQIREQVKSLVGYTKYENSPNGKKERTRDSIWVTNKKY